MDDKDGLVRHVGTLVRDAGGFALRTENGTLIHLHLHRVPVDLVEKRVTVSGRMLNETVMEAEGVAPNSVRPALDRT